MNPQCPRCQNHTNVRLWHPTGQWRWICTSCLFLFRDQVAAA